MHIPWICCSCTTLQCNTRTADNSEWPTPRLIEFRRGVKRCATVYSLSFSQDSEYLALSSNTETIHIFKMEEPVSGKPEPEIMIQLWNVALHDIAQPVSKFLVFWFDLTLYLLVFLTTKKAFTEYNNFERIPTIFYSTISHIWYCSNVYTKSFVLTVNPLVPRAHNSERDNSF